MNKSFIVIGIITVVLLLGGVFLVTRPKKPVELPPYDPAKLIYFWGNGCPHCANVDEFINGWENKDKLEVQKFEVWYNNSNQALMSKLAAEKCDLKPQGMSVPLLIKPDGSCLNGDEPIIEYYKSLSF
jgi:hypothetical protein